MVTKKQRAFAPTRSQSLFHYHQEWPTIYIIVRFVRVQIQSGLASSVRDLMIIVNISIIRPFTAFSRLVLVVLNIYVLMAAALLHTSKNESRTGSDDLIKDFLNSIISA